MEKNNVLLAAILSKLPENTLTDVSIFKDINTRKSDQNFKSKENKDELAEWQINELKKSMQEGDVLVKMAHNGKFDIRKKSDVEESIKAGKGDLFKVLLEK